MERQKILNPLTGRMVYADGVVAKSIPKMKKSVGVLEGAVKRTGTTKIAEKKEAVGKLSGAIKRRLAKKPKKIIYGWEDLPDDIQDKISGIVKKNEYERRGGKNVDDMREYVKQVSNYYGFGLEDKTIMDMDKGDLYDFAYKGELDFLIDDAFYKYKLSRRGRYDTYDRIGIYIYKDKEGRETDLQVIKGAKVPLKAPLLTYPDYGDNRKLFNYLVNHPVNTYSTYSKHRNTDKFVLRDFKGYYDAFFIFLGDDVNLNGSNSDDYELVTLVEVEYNDSFTDEKGRLIRAYAPSPSIPLRIFRVKIPRNKHKEDLHKVPEKWRMTNWTWALRMFRQDGWDYNDNETILEYKEKGVLKQISSRRPLPDIKKP